MSRRVTLRNGQFDRLHQRIIDQSQTLVIKFFISVTLNCNISISRRQNHKHFQRIN